MSQLRIKTELREGFYFVTMTAHRWYYIFDRHNRWQILADAIRFAQENRGLLLCGYVFMLNHIHLVAASPDMLAFVRDFKRYTSLQMRENIKIHEPNLLALFCEKGSFSLWRETNSPKRIESGKFMLQKCRYVEFNPVRKEYVAKPEHWRWSSACPESPLEVWRDW